MGRRSIVARHGKRQRKSNFWLWWLAIAGLVVVIAGVVVYGLGSQGPSEVQGVLKPVRLTKNIGNVPYGGGLAKATFELSAEGGPVTVKTIATT